MTQSSSFYHSKYPTSLEHNSIECMAEIYSMDIGNDFVVYISGLVGGGSMVKQDLPDRPREQDLYQAI